MQNFTSWWFGDHNWLRRPKWHWPAVPKSPGPSSKLKEWLSHATSHNFVDRFGRKRLLMPVGLSELCDLLRPAQAIQTQNDCHDQEISTWMLQSNPLHPHFENILHFPSVSLVQKFGSSKLSKVTNSFCHRARHLIRCHAERLREWLFWHLAKAQKNWRVGVRDSAKQHKKDSSLSFWGNWKDVSFNGTTSHLDVAKSEMQRCVFEKCRVCSWSFWDGTESQQRGQSQRKDFQLPSIGHEVWLSWKSENHRM